MSTSSSPSSTGTVSTGTTNTVVHTPSTTSTTTPLAPELWNIKASDVAQRANNPIRKIVDNIKKPEMARPLIPLSLGDPTIFGNLKAPEVLVRTVEQNLKSYRHNGYIHSAGSIEARKSIAVRYTLPNNPLTENDVIIASGCSGALDLAITVLLNPNDILLVPRPAFPLYATLCESKGILIRQYNLLPDKEWEIDLPYLDTLIKNETQLHHHRIGAILVNNPSNPCGSVYSEQHLKDILTIAETHRIPVIADEIYGGLVFPSSGKKFYPMASLTNTVPILACGGIAKEFLVPGWRVGWITIYDPLQIFQDIRKGLFALSQLILGANSLILSALPAILTPIPDSDDAISLENFHLDTIEQLEDNAKLCVDRIRQIPGLDVIVPSGAMYLMFSIQINHFNDIKDDIDFAQKLLSEENVFVLPGTAFNIPYYCRIVFCAPSDKLEDAFNRINDFCLRHAKSSTATNTTVITGSGTNTDSIASKLAPTESIEEMSKQILVQEAREQ